VNPRNKKGIWTGIWVKQLSWEWNLQVYPPPPTPCSSPYTRSPIISHHFVPLFKVTLGSLIAFLCCHNQLFLLSDHITKHEGYVICIVMRRPEIYQSSPQRHLSVTVDNREWRDQFAVVEVLGRKFADIRVLK